MGYFVLGIFLMLLGLVNVDLSRAAWRTRTRVVVLLAGILVLLIGIGEALFGLGVI